MIFGEQTNKYILFIAFYKIIKSISQLLLRGKLTSTKKVNDDQLPAIFDEVNRPEIEREVTMYKTNFPPSQQSHVELEFSGAVSAHSFKPANIK